jgi:hypothetical protein
VRRVKQEQLTAQAGRTAFLKERSKRLLPPGRGAAGNSEPKWQKFFGSFFQKRTSSLPVLALMGQRR